MTEPAEIIAKALREASVPPDAPTRLATVTDGDATTIRVRFDGEANASTRPYSKTFAPVYLGDRVIMLRTGSTWVAIGRIPQGATTSPDTGLVALANDPGVNPAPYGIATAGYRRNGIVTVNIECQTLLAYAVGYGVFSMPAGMLPTRRIWVNCGSPFAANRNYSLLIETNGVCITQVPIPNGEVLLGHATFPAAG